MKQLSWKKHHKWFGLLFGFFLLMFCLSGIILNHRNLVATLNISRRFLPESYHYNQWNNGLLRGTLTYNPSGQEAQSIFIYGNNGIWRTDSTATTVTGFNQGLPPGTDHRNIRGMVSTPDGELLAAGIFGLYHSDGQGPWTEIQLPLASHERISDITRHNDTIIVTGRSYLYVATPPYRSFSRIEIQASHGFDKRVSLFRTVWLMHSGELFGTVGKLIMDAVALILIFLTLTGILHWLLPKHIRWRRGKGHDTQKHARILKQTRFWHDRTGRYTLLLLLFVTVTGWCLRPPVLIALVHGKVPAIPGTRLDSPNAWNDKLRMLRYDADTGEWLLSTSEGFYSLSALSGKPVRMEQAPPVSVMGLNVFQKNACGQWITGSFSGLYLWDREQKAITDYFTGEPAPETAGPPFGKQAIAGFSDAFGPSPCIADYVSGSPVIHMPEELSHLPISLWGLALEVHTGRIYTILGQGTLAYIFIAGLATFWCIWTGYKLKKRRKTPPQP